MTVNASPVANGSVQVTPASRAIVTTSSVPTTAGSARRASVASARQAARAEATLARRALPAVVGTLLVVTIARLAGVTWTLPFATGLAFTVMVALLAVVALARKG